MTSAQTPEDRDAANAGTQTPEDRDNATTDTQTPRESDVPLWACVVSINRGRAYSTTEGYVHYLDRQAAEDAAKDPINRLLNFIKRHLPRRN